MQDRSYVRAFETLGLGLFVHFGLYSVLGQGEWAQELCRIPAEDYERDLTARFMPAPDWAEQLAAAAEGAGCRYITLTTRHHDGFSLYDAGELSAFDALHVCGRDLVREFVDACRRHGIVPFFYHTLLDWREPSFRTDFPAYLRYLRAGVERLCTRYGKIGGLWFDGKWSRPNDDWEEDALYGTIRAHQPEAIIVNNSGLEARGVRGHEQIDCVTFERGRPQACRDEPGARPVAIEMCQTMNDHWGYAADDIDYKSPAEILHDLLCCRRYGAQLLLNIGPKGDGTLRTIDAGMLELIGRWMSKNGEAMYAPRPCGIAVEGRADDFLLQDGDTYYLFCDHLPMMGDPNVVLSGKRDDFTDRFTLGAEIVAAEWLDDGSPVCFSPGADGRIEVTAQPFGYGRSMVARVARLRTVHR